MPVSTSRPTEVNTGNIVEIGPTGSFFSIIDPPVACIVASLEQKAYPL